LKDKELNMTTDINGILRNIEMFYDVRDKSVIHVGAGGGQSVNYLRNARSILGVDPDEQAVGLLKIAIDKAGLADKYEIIQKSFFDITIHADVVFFEFCLHEIDDPYSALSHAQLLAPVILIADHAPGSPWCWCTAEEEKVKRSWAAVRRFPIIREISHDAIQRFVDYAEIHSKVAGLGEPTLTRIQKYIDQKNIEVEMGYDLALL
jgi:hypothetical protein